MVRMQDEYAVECALEHRVDHIFLARVGKHHVQKIACVAQAVTRVHIGLTGAVFVGHCHQGWHLGNQPDRRDVAVLRIVDVGAVMVEGRQRANEPGHDRHRMGVPPETPQKKLHLLVHHRVVGDSLDEICLTGDVGQGAVQQQMASLQKVAVGG